MQISIVGEGEIKNTKVWTALVVEVQLSSLTPHSNLHGDTCQPSLIEVWMNQLSMSA